MKINGMLEIKEFKKYYMKVFDKNEELWKDFLRFYKEVLTKGSSIPQEVAMIRFRDKYIETDEGWVKR